MMKMYVQGILPREIELEEIYVWASKAFPGTYYVNNRNSQNPHIGKAMPKTWEFIWA